MSATLPLGDHWGIAAAADRRFRRLGTACTALVLASLLSLQLWELAEPPRIAVPLRVQVLPLPPPRKPAPKPERKPAPAAKEVVAKAAAKPAPKAEPEKPSARAIAEQAGLMALREQLSTLRRQDIGAAANPQQLMREVALQAGARSASAIASAASKGSAGIAGGNGVSAVQGTGSLGARRTAAVQSTLGSGAAPGANGTQDRGGSRSLQELQLAFDRSKSSFFSIFNRAARERADMGAGKIVVSLTIAPDGSVTRCELVSSSFDDAALEQKILQRVRLLNFGAKDVPSYTYPNYPISFLPS